MADPLTRGSRGEGVRDLQARLGVLGFRCDADPTGMFGGATEASVHAFQRDRGLRVDGVVGRHTWSSLVESGFSLGDRLLYFRQPLLRGDDVADLQRRLNTLGFDARRVDGLFGPETQRALVEFQRSTGLVPDGICGPDAVAALDRVGGLAAGSVAAARERDALRRGPHRIEGRRIFVAAPPGLAVVGDNVARGLTLARAVVVLDASGDDESVLARAANGFDADLYLGLAFGTGAPRCVHFATTGFRSETGVVVADAVARQLADELAEPAAVVGAAYPVLRETRMAAVVCELVPSGDAPALAAVVHRSGAVARAVVRGVRQAWERPTRDDPTRDDPPGGGAPPAG